MDNYFLIIQRDKFSFFYWIRERGDDLLSSYAKVVNVYMGTFEQVSEMGEQLEKKSRLWELSEAA